MEILLLILALTATAAAVAFAVYAHMTRIQLRQRTGEAAALQSRLDEQDIQLRQLQSQHAADEQRIAGFRDMREQFSLLANRVLQENQQGFLSLANEKFLEHMRPVGELLETYRKELTEIEKNRKESEGSLRNELKSLMSGQQNMRDEAARLREALRGSAQARGRWGEQSLRNAAELAGMSEHCDFFSQHEVASGDSRLRPDMVIRMPDGGALAVDAKTPLENYINALEATDAETRATHLHQYARNLRGHMQTLGGKEYWRGLEPSPEFVVMYVPGDHFLAAALEEMPNLWEEAIDRRVLIATPTIFLALVRTVAYGWKARAAEENVNRIADLGKELYDRLTTMGEHVDRMGRSLDGAVKHYNGFVGSLEARVLPKAREFRDLGAITGTGELPRPERIQTALRSLAAPELETPKPTPKDTS